MPNLISPGVSVDVTDVSFYTPNAAATVPLIFIATKEDKRLADLTTAVGTTESGVIRAISSVPQSVKMYGVPKFYTYHGDARSEYGLMALNQFLHIGNRAFVVRANIDTDDERTTVLPKWNMMTTTAVATLEALAAAKITTFNNINGYAPLNPLYKVTITQSELLDLVGAAMSPVYAKYLFSDRQANPLLYFSTMFKAAHVVATPELKIYGNGFDHAPTGDYIGLAGITQAWVAGLSGATVGHETEWTPTEAGDILTLAVDMFKITPYFLDTTSLGATNQIRRDTEIVPKLLQQIVSNHAVRSETYEYNLILCPGYPEAVADMVTLSANIKNEAFVIGSVPFDKDVDAMVTWSSTSARIRAEWLAYYYPHGLATNLDGNTIFCDGVGAALAVYAYNDDVAEVWYPPAGLNRGNIANTSGIKSIGFLSGLPGTATATYEALSLDNGQRDSLYGSPTFINPYVNDPSLGSTVFGQRTSVAGNVAKASDRVNVARLLVYCRRTIRKSLAQFLFELNDEQTRGNVVAMITNFMAGIQLRRGVYDFAVLCDDSNNTPETIDNNQLYVEIAIKPTKAIEFIYASIRVVRTGDSLTG